MRLNSIRLRKPIGQTLRGRVEAYEFQVGVLRDGPHKAAVSKSKGHKSFAGGPSRKTGRRIDGTLSEISAKAREATGVNYLTKPFERKNDDAVKMVKGFWKLVFSERAENTKKRFENLVQAVVRNPILRRTYGPNKAVTRDAKGFNHKFVDTAQLFRAITAKVKKVKVGRSV